MHQLSEGTLRFLWLTALLLSRALPTVTLIDEPEVSLHPELQRFLLDLMREATRRTHLIVATHSDSFVRFATPAEVLIADVDEQGFVSFARGDSLSLGRWLEDYSLDQLWHMGKLGGRS
jgi:predicted ATPase